VLVLYAYAIVAEGDDMIVSAAIILDEYLRALLAKLDGVLHQVLE
jgi:hypothetical protein